MIIAGAGLAIAWLAGCSIVEVSAATFGIRMWEERPHEVLVRDGSYQIRDYAPTIAARTDVPTDSSQPSNSGFGQLAGYIFGGNESDTSIAMTMPVEMVEQPADADAGQRQQMSFFMPAKFTRDSLPAPDDASVELVEVPGELLAIYRFSGYGSMRDIATYEPKLTTWLAERGYTPVGRARIAMYDPPWTIPFLRRNEVVIPIEREQDASGG